MLNHKIIIAGFGGQGIISAGRLLTYAGMLENHKVSSLPSYGPEMRGGTACCHIIISDNSIKSPFIETATSLIIMNEPSLIKYEAMLEKDGLLFYDNSVTTLAPLRKDIKISAVPATSLASEMGNITFANIIMIGAFLAKTSAISRDNIIKGLYKILPEKKHYLIPDEIKALDMGMEFSPSNIE